MGRKRQGVDIDDRCNPSILFGRLILLLSFAFLVLPAARSQTQGSTGSPNFESPSDLPRNGEPTPQELGRQKLLAAQQIKNQEELTANVAKILVLTRELKAEMDKSTKDTLSLSVVKKAEEVEKLAHKVRDEMKKSMGN